MRLHPLLILCMIVGAHDWWIHTHCTLMLGREACGADRYLPDLRF
jgi:hypothetical protein